MTSLISRPTAHPRLIACVALAIAGLGLTRAAYGFSRNGTTLTTDGSFADVSAAVGSANDGDTVTIPAGNFTWGDNASRLYLTKAITLAGAGQGSTTIQISPTGPTGQNPLINLLAAATVRDFSIAGTNAYVPVFSAGGTNGWRITSITYTPASTVGSYFCIISGSYGLIDHCNITGANGSNELIFGRGPTNSWQTPASTGGADNVFIEDCTFNGPGYVCDANSNARFVVRFCTITGRMKVDGHGVASNSPPRGVREMEVYDNTWTTDAPTTPIIEIRGGTGYIFGNRLPNLVGGYGWFFLTDYGYTGAWPNFGNQYQTPVNYPVTDQIGVGQDPKVAASEPMYLWDNLSAVKTDAGAATVDWPLTFKNIPTAAVTLYQSQIGDPTATYTLRDVIKADRDYFKQTVGTTFDGSSGVGVGTKAQMLAITGKKVGVGFWVTDEGEWNSLHNGPDGQLYVWNGTSWVFKYKPYTYPNPMATGSAPTPVPPPAPSNAPLNDRVRIQPVK